MIVKAALSALVVECEQPLDRLLQSSLEMVGLRVTLACGGAAARACLAAEEFALLVLSLSLPAGEWEIFEHWREGCPGAAGPCLLLEPLGGTAPEAVRREPWARVVGKPFSPPELVMLSLRLLAESGRYRPPVQASPDGRRGVAVDVGCGTGMSTCRLAEELGPTTLVIGLDVQPANARTARDNARLLGYRSVAGVAADAAALPFADGSVARVQGIEALAGHAAIDRQVVAAEARRVAPVEP